METGFAIVALVTLVLNLVLPEEIEDEETPELTADETDEGKDQEEWERIRRGKEMEGEARRASSSDITPATKTV